MFLLLYPLTIICRLTNLLFEVGGCLGISEDLLAGNQHKAKRLSLNSSPKNGNVYS